MGTLNSLGMKWSSMNWSRKPVYFGFALQTALLCYLVISTGSRNECQCQKREFESRLAKPSAESNDNPLKFYSLSNYARRGWMFPIDSKFCVLTKKVDPEFEICVHDPAHDIFISKDILNQGYWETDMAGWLNAIRPKMVDPVLYMDLGSNLGIHGLHAAKSNCTVWAVEPQEKNLQRIMQSSILSGVYHQMTFIQNAVDGVRRKVQMSVDRKNNGGSYIKELQDESAEAIETVLLSDIFHEALTQSQPKNVVLKADIETYECRAFLNSQQVFAHPTIKSVIFEWAGESDNCSADDFRKVLNLLRQNGLTLYQQRWSAFKWEFDNATNVSDDELLKWKGVNLFWSKVSP